MKTSSQLAFIAFGFIGLATAAKSAELFFSAPTAFTGPLNTDPNFSDRNGHYRAYDIADNLAFNATILDSEDPIDFNAILSNIHQPEFLVDGNYANGRSFIPKQGTLGLSSFTLDLGAVSSIGSFKFGRDRAGQPVPFNDRLIGDFSVELSLDDFNYIEVLNSLDFTIDPGGFTPGWSLTGSFDAFDARYVRFNYAPPAGANTPEADEVGIDEFEVFAATSSVPLPTSLALIAPALLGLVRLRKAAL